MNALLYSEQNRNHDWPMSLGQALPNETGPQPQEGELHNQHGQKDFHENMARLQRRYRFKNEKAVCAFLTGNRAVIPMLLAAASELETAFDHRSLLALEAMDEEDSQGTLYALARWSGTSQAARDSLRRFDEGWLVENSDAVNGRIVFDYELI